MTMPNFPALLAKYAAVEAARPQDPVPSGDYTADLTASDFVTSKGGHPECRLTFTIADGEHAGKRLWHSLYLTDKAMPYTKGFLQSIGLSLTDVQTKPVPDIRCQVRVSLRRTDAGSQFNTLSVLSAQPRKAN